MSLWLRPLVSNKTHQTAIKISKKMGVKIWVIYTLAINKLYEELYEDVNK